MGIAAHIVFEWQLEPVAAIGSDIEIESTSAKSEFPDGIRFEIVASSPSLINEIAVNFRVGQQISGVYEYLDFESAREVNGTLFWQTNTSAKYVPPGTIIRNSETKQIMKDLTESNETCIVAKGGNGGFGNARFKTQKNTAPRIANDGQKGESLKIDLELKVLADVGLVGFPNAGKSTFISRVSNAHPKIADYPFTTLTPNLGIVKYGNFQSFVLADIPGLIHGASAGKGLGSQFLRHIERTKVLVYMLDATSENIVEDLCTLKSELEQHNATLLSRPSLLLITKIDLLPEDLREHLITYHDKSIENINKKLTLVEKIKKIQLIDENFSIENGLLTPTMKVKRKKVTEKYKKELEKLY